MCGLRRCLAGAVLSAARKVTRRSGFQPLRAARQAVRALSMHRPLCADFAKTTLPNIADQVYIDWQLDVAAALARLPMRLILRPHPEGLFRGKPHPLAAAGAAFAAFVRNFARARRICCVFRLRGVDHVLGSGLHRSADRLSRPRHEPFRVRACRDLRDRLRTVYVNSMPHAGRVVDRDALADAVLGRVPAGRIVAPSVRGRA